MHQRDYILRLIEQMGGMLAQLRRRILGRGTAPELVDQELASVASRSGFDLELLRGLTEDTLLFAVSPGGDVEPSRCWLMAEVLYLDGLQAEVEDRLDDAVLSYGKARTLFTLIEPAGGLLVGLPEAAERVDDIDARLERLGRA